MTQHTISGTVLIHSSRAEDDTEQSISVTWVVRKGYKHWGSWANHLNCPFTGHQLLRWVCSWPPAWPAQFTESCHEWMIPASTEIDDDGGSMSCQPLNGGEMLLKEGQWWGGVKLTQTEGTIQTDKHVIIWKVSIALDYYYYYPLESAE